jgi:hypothetical protein
MTVMKNMFTVSVWLTMFGVACPLGAQDLIDVQSPSVADGANVGSLDVSALGMSRPEDTFNADAGPIAGQIGKPDPAPPTPRHTGIKAMVKALGRDVINLPSRQNLFIAVVGTGATLAVHPLDPSANDDLAGPRLNTVFKPGATLGQSYTLLPAAVAVYAFGRLADEPKVSHTGSDLIQSVLIAELMTQTLKYTVRRERPDGSGANSFPSGHAADTMAFATALERHFDWRYFLPAYAFASYVAISRLHDNVHYVSDVVAGATVGIIAGRTVTRPGHGSFPITVMAVPGGFGVMYVRGGN